MAMRSSPVLLLSSPLVVRQKSYFSLLFCLFIQYIVYFILYPSSFATNGVSELKCGAKFVAIQRYWQSVCHYCHQQLSWIIFAIAQHFLESYLNEESQLQSKFPDCLRNVVQRRMSLNSFSNNHGKNSFLLLLRWDCWLHVCNAYTYIPWYVNLLDICSMYVTFMCCLVLHIQIQEVRRLKFKFQTIWHV